MIGVAAVHGAGDVTEIKAILGGKLPLMKAKAPPSMFTSAPAWISADGKL
jgi:hypothetical protein